MSGTEKHIVIPYRQNRGKLVPGEMRAASNAESARRICEAMSSRFPGVAAYTVTVDMETGDMTSPALLSAYGPVPELTVD